MGADGYKGTVMSEPTGARVCSSVRAHVNAYTCAEVGSQLMVERETSTDKWRHLSVDLTLGRGLR